MKKASKSFGGEYDCLQSWPDNCYLQCGGSGIVFKKDTAYTTAFFEAFPRNPNTFIRGEGKDIEEAELNAWNKYQKIINCVGHELKRTNGENGICVHCNMSQIHSFPPEHSCSVCNKANVNYVDFLDEKVHYCRTHYLDLLEDAKKIAFTTDRDSSEGFNKSEAGRFQLKHIKFINSMIEHELINNEIPEYSESHRIEDLELNFSMFLRNKIVERLNEINSELEVDSKIKFNMLEFSKFTFNVFRDDEKNTYEALVYEYLFPDIVHKNDDAITGFIYKYKT
jgi:hypothetical protein